MAIGIGLNMRQSQSLVMTPQLLQAIKLLQLSTIELNAYVEQELERNPLLERGEDMPDIDRPGLASDDAGGSEPSEAQSGDWAGNDLATSREVLESRLDTDLGNAFPDEAAPSESANGDGLTVSSSVWSGVSGGGFDGEDENAIDRAAEARPSLRDHLHGQLTLATADPLERLIGRLLIDAIDDNGYLTDSVEAVAERLDAQPQRVEAVLRVIQGFEPSGVGCRTLSECLAIQLRDIDRFDPAMAAVIGRLDLLAKRDYAALMKLAQIDEEDLRGIIKDIRALDPKPGRIFGGEPASPVMPDVFVRPASDGSWIIELNSDALPRVLVNQAYYTKVTKATKSDTEKTFVQECFQTANWLTRSLDQRAKTILKVATEIVRQQDAFFVNGVSELRPLNLRAVADAIGMHESTVSRVTSNKFMATHRGLFEMKYFFTTSIASADGGDAHSAEAVRHKIKQMIDAETVATVLSDDAIVTRLKDSGIDIARRTVAKYRESLRIPSSVERKREKSAMTA
ncbi:MAG: RNA polymerase factor sigma-54 [Beijerinckiaceae bacterium]